MYRKIVLVFSALVFLSGILSAQPWKEKPNGSKKPNFHSMKSAGDALLEPVRAQRGKGFKALKRWENYWETRVNANGDFPAANQLQQSWNAYITSPGLAAPVPGSSWSSMGPTSSAGGYAGIGRINRVAFHPTNSSTYFASTAGGGLWKTTNGGSTWTSLTDNLASIGTSGLVINPTNTNIMYLATGDGDGYDTYSYGVLKTTDGGTNWSATGLSFTPGWVIYKIVMHPNDPNILLVGTNGGIFRTTDAGVTWTQVVTNISAYDLEFKPGDPTYVYAGADGSVYRSTSTGASGTWTQVGIFTGGDRTAIAVSANNPGLVGVLVSDASDSGFLGYYTSSNSGTSFSVIYNGPSNLMGWESDGSDSGGQGWYDLCMAIDPNDANVVYVGGVNVWKSTDGGSSWNIAGHWYGQSGTPEIHADHHDLSFQPGTNTLFSTNDGGVYSYTGSAWTDRTNGMAISQMYRISASQTTTKVISGLQDNGTKLLSTTGTWTDVNGGDGMECGIDPSNANYMYSTVYYGSLYRSTNGSPFWQDEITPANSSGAWVSPFVMDPVTPSTIYLGHKVLWKSTNRGTNWTNISSSLTGNTNISHIAVAPSDNSTIYVTWSNAGQKIARTSNGGSTWTTYSSPSSSSPTSVMVDPTNASVVYMTFSNYTSGAKVYRSSNGGANWTNISGTLPNVPANTIVYRTGSKGCLYLGMDAGVYYRDSTMTDWALYNSNLPNVEIFDLEIRNSDKTLIAGTYGRGLWSSPLYLETPTLATTAASSIGTTSASVGGSITDEGTMPVTARGVVWSTSPNPTVTLITKTTNGSGPGTFTSSITGLSPNTTYYVRAYATSADGTAYGTQTTFTTTGSVATLPTVSTTSISGITSTTATSGGEVTADGGASVSVRGVVWSLSSGPTVDLSTKTTDGMGTGTFSSSISGLSAGTTYFVRAYATNSAGTAYGSELSFTTAAAANLPTLTTDAISSITATSATGGGNISADGGSFVMARGVVWGTSSAPTTSLSTKTFDGTDVGAFSSSITNLSPNTTYYVRAYAVNSTGTAYGNERSFTTPVSLPTLTTVAAANITGTSATSVVNISSNGGATITAKGIVWSTSQNPDISLNTKTSNTSSATVFDNTLSGLSPLTTYYARGYATNSAGTAYGNQISFTTTATTPTLTTTAVSGVTGSGATSGGNISSDGGAAVTARGVVWGTSQNPTTALSTKTSDGTGTGSFSSSITGLSTGTTYYVRAYATNSVGTAYGSQVSFTTTANVPTLSTLSAANITATSATSVVNISSNGGATITAKGIVWGTSQNPDISLNTKTSNVSSATVFDNDLTGLSPSTTYYARGYATNSAGTAYGNQISFTTTAPAPPTLTTTVVSGVTTSGASSGGDISSDGGASVTARGVVWGTAQNPDISLSTKTSNGTGTGSFSSSISGLNPGTTYYVRAYATNSAGTAYGSERSFTTTASTPTLTTTAVSSITTSGASSGGDISSNGGASVSARGVVWGTSQNPTTALSTKTSDGTGTGSFSSSITNLNPGTTYYVRAYATNSVGTAYGNQLSFTSSSASPPTLTTAAVSSITGTSASSGGTISSNGGATVTARGVVWSTLENPTIALSTKTSNGSGTGTFPSSITGLSPGTTYYVRAYATNSAGTAYGNQVSFTTLKIPVVSSFSPTSGTSGTAVLIKGNFFTGATAVRFGGTAASSFTVVDSTMITAIVGSGASGTVSVTTSIGTGSRSGFSYVASSVPTITSFSPTSASPEQIVVINGTNFKGATSVTFGAVAAKLFWVNSTTKITAVVGTGASGNVVVTTPGGTATRAGFNFIPTPTPDVSSFSPASARRNQTVTILGTDFKGITAVTFGGVAARSFSRVSSTAITAVVGNGASGHIAVTGSGGVDSLAGFTFVSSAPPSVRSFSPTSGASGYTIQIKGTGFTGATAVSFGGTAASSFSVLNDSTIDAVVGSGASGNVKVTTPGGSSSRGGFSYIVMASPPTVASFTPTSARNGQTVTIKGTNFAGASSVTFGGTAAKSFSVVNATTIVAVVGSGASGSVSVVTPAGTATLSGFTFISAAAPTISSFSPSGASNGGTVVITGTNFSGATAVRFGGVAAASFTVNSATSISAVVGSGASGSVSVTTPGGTATRSGFVYNAAASPSISSFSPISAYTGKVVTISGTGFLGTTSVKFGGVNAKSFSVLNDNSIVATVGAGTSGDVSVTNPIGTGSRSGFTFSPPPVPVVSAFAPDSASTNQVVVISGSGFSGWVNVRFGGTLAKSASVLNDSTITATVGSGSSGNVIVTTAGGADTLAGFVYIPPGAPTVTSFSPTSASNGQTVLIRGTNFKGWATVSFGGTAAKSVSVVDSTFIVAVVGSGASGSVRVTTGGGYAELAGFTYAGGALQPTGYVSGDDAGLSSEQPDKAGLGQDQRIRAQVGSDLPEHIRMLLYPNPSDGVVNLQVNAPEDTQNGYQLRVLDALGREVRRIDRLQSGSYTVDLSGNPAGLYYFVLFDSKHAPVASQRVLLR